MYIYTEASPPRKENDIARIALSRTRSISCMKFFYHMYGEHINQLTLSINSPSQQGELWVKTGPQGSKWLEAKLTIVSSDKYQVQINYCYFECKNDFSLPGGGTRLQMW